MNDHNPVSLVVAHIRDNMKYLKITLPQGKSKEQQHRFILVCDFDNTMYTDNSVIADCVSHNQLRQRIAILLRYAENCNPVLGNLDLRIMRGANGEYRLLTYTRNWSGRASYYAGIIVGIERYRRNRRKKKRRQAA